MRKTSTRRTRKNAGKPVQKSKPVAGLVSGQPARRGRFQPGQSGNPSGRPSGQKAAFSFQAAIAKRLASPRFAKRLLDHAEAGSASALKVLSEYLPPPAPPEPPKPKAPAMNWADYPVEDLELLLEFRRRQKARQAKAIDVGSDQDPVKDNGTAEQPESDAAPATDDMDAPKPSRQLRRQWRLRREGKCIFCGRMRGPGEAYACAACKSKRRGETKPAAPIPAATDAGAATTLPSRWCDHCGYFQRDPAAVLCENCRNNRAAPEQGEDLVGGLTRPRGASVLDAGHEDPDHAAIIQRSQGGGRWKQ
jgi:hypothetical protein